MYVCLCNDVTEDKIREAIYDGYNTLADLIDHLGVTTGCGICKEQVCEVLEKNKFKLDLFR
jgi:bacterioferritin-associated ferredoxin